MKKLSVTLCLIILISSLCGCSNAISAGEVYQKVFKEEHTQVRLIPLIITDGNTHRVMQIPYVVHYPDRYVVYVKSFQDGDLVTEDFYVTKDVYDNISIGDMFEYDVSRGDLKDEPYTKEKAEERKE